jgi:hypothetical protein
MALGALLSLAVVAGLVWAVARALAP